MYINPNDSFYLEEAYQRMLHYPPPYLGMYMPPWLWYDGDKHGGFDFTLWDSMIVIRMNQPAPVTITMWGSYTPADGSGTIYAQFRNDSTATLNGRVLFVVTEDSIYYHTTYIDWHNHVPRDYLPDHNGTIVSIPTGDSITVSQPFTIQPGWDVNRCQILTWIQDTIMQADSTIEIWQGDMIDVTELGIEEENTEYISNRKVFSIPNPCVDATAFSFNLPAGIAYQIEIFDVLGRHVRTLNGISSENQESVKWNCRDDAGFMVGTGVYLYQFKSNIINTGGKLVVR